MPSKPSSDKPGWRGGAGKPAGRGRPIGQKPAQWTKKKERRYERALSRHRAKLAAWSILLVTLIGLLAWYVLRGYERTPMLVAVVTDYSRPLPPNAWAREDLTLLKRLEEGSPEGELRVVKHVSVQWTSGQRGLKDLLDTLDGQDPGGPDRNVIIIYLSMHGAVNDRNQPCLLPPGATASKPADWLKVSDLLEGLQESAPGVKKLLILDANRMDSNWGLGMLYNGFADRLKEIFTGGDYSDLFVLNSAGPGQIGWAAPELGGSVFCHFLWRALSGDAAGDDNQVSLLELHGYLKDSVNHWVRTGRDDQQVPMLLPGDPDDFPLVNTPSRQGATDHPAKIFLREHQQSVQGWWNDRQQQQGRETVQRFWRTHQRLLGGADPYRVNPVKWEDFQHRLLHLEQLADAGEAYEEAFGTAASELKALVPPLEPTAVDEGLTAYGLPLAQRFHRADMGPDKVNAARDALAERLQQPTAADQTESGTGGPAEGAKQGPDSPQPAKTAGDQPPEEQKQDQTQDQTQDQKQGEKDLAAAKEPSEKSGAGPPDAPEFGYLAAAQALWDWALGDWALENVADLGKLAAALQFLDRRDARPEGDVVELHFLRMLQEYLDRPVWQQESNSVQTALITRRQAENAAAPGDPRTHYGVRQMVDQADDQRRRAEDKLFVGNQVQLAREELDAAGGAYDKAIATAAELAQAFRVRDQALAKTPYLAQWLLSRLWKDESYREQLGFRESLRQLINDTHRLDAALREFQPGAGPQKSPAENGASPDSPKGSRFLADLQGKRRAVQAGLAKLEEALQEEYRDLLGQTGDHKARLRRTVAVLAVPPITGDDRNRLRQRYLEDVRPRDFADELYSGQDDSSGSSSESGYVARLARWPEHPASAILRLAHELPDGEGSLLSPEKQPESGEPPQAQQDPQQQLADEGAKVRRLLYDEKLGVYDTAKERLQSTKRMLCTKYDGKPPSPPDVRAEGSKADRLVRASAALCGEQLWKDDQHQQRIPNPIGQLHELDLHYLLLWQANRTLEDFWGPRPGRSDRGAFFQIAADGYLKSARRLIERVCPESLSLQPTEIRLAELTTTPYRAPLRPLAPDEPRPIDVAQEQITQAVTVKVAEKLPSGEAAFYLKETWKSGRLLPMLGKADAYFRRRSIGIPATAPGPVRWSIDNSDYLRDTAAVRAVALYRGHLSDDCVCYFPPAEGFDVSFQPPEYVYPTVTVSEPSVTAPSVVFILDCSGSMSAVLGGIEGNSRRVDVAGDALDYILGVLLASEEKFHIGAMIYGSQAEWDKQYYQEHRKDRIKYRTEERVHPCVDVKWLAEPGVLTADRKEDIRRQLENSAPGGSTPLYLAIIKALKEHRARTEKRHIVVITDGLNDQRVSTRGLSAEEMPSVKMPEEVFIDGISVPARRYLRDVGAELTKAGKQDVRLDVLGFDLVRQKLSQRDRKEYDELLRFLKEDRRRGFYDAGSGADLEKFLLQILIPRRYKVLSPSGTVQGADLVKLGKTSEIRQDQGHTRQYQVQLVDLLQGTNGPKLLAGNWVTFQGGEGPRLHFKGSPQLVFQTPQDLCEEAVADKSKQFYIQAHNPRREAGNRSRVRFELSLWYQDETKFTPRPKEIWMEVTPILPNESGTESNRTGYGTPRTIYDLGYRPLQPAPRLGYLDHNWPAEADRAEIQLWFKFRETLEDDVSSALVKDLLQPWLFGSVEFRTSVKDLEQPTDPCRVEIVEKHPSDGDLRYVKVEMDPPPNKVIHRFIPQARRVRHTFFYENKNPSDVMAYKVRFTTREKAVSEAFVVDRPLTVPLP